MPRTMLKVRKGGEMTTKYDISVLTILAKTMTNVTHFYALLTHISFNHLYKYTYFAETRKMGSFNIEFLITLILLLFRLKMTANHGNAIPEANKGVRVDFQYFIDYINSDCATNASYSFSSLQYCYRVF